MGCLGKPRPWQVVTRLAEGLLYHSRCLEGVEIIGMEFCNSINLRGRVKDSVNSLQTCSHPIEKVAIIPVEIK